ncbi:MULTISPECIES: acyltransferase family protein [unclassified Inquilinus]|uniref:acyltransferase family protein n=1 Tax=unclassified Inquilinus TaxID=2645927 RepID=UPI003F93536C
MKLRFDDLTSLRGVAALSVAAMHLWLDLNNQALIAADSVFNTGTQFIAKSYLFVDFFFVLSGFVLFISYAGEFSTRINLRDWKTFLVRRIGRLFPLHLFMLALFLPYELSRIYLSTGSSAFAPPNTVENFVLSIFLMQAWVPHGFGWNSPAWSISAEWFVNIFFPVLAFIVLRQSRAFSAAAAVILLAGIGVWCLFIAPDVQLWNNSNYPLLRCAMEFTIGLCIGRLSGADLVRATPAIPVIGSQLSIAAILAAAILAMHLGLNDTYPVVAFSLLIYAIAVRRKDTAFLSPRPLRLLGEWSYSIYLVHRLICVVTSFVVSRLMHGRMLTDLEAAAMFVAVLAVVIGVSALTYRWIEVPARRAVYGMTIRNARTA